MLRNFRRYGRWERQAIKQGLTISDETPRGEGMQASDAETMMVARDSNGELVGGFMTDRIYSAGFLYADAKDLREQMRRCYEEMCV
jgi:hypothetical protein